MSRLPFAYQFARFSAAIIVAAGFLFGLTGHAAERRLVLESTLRVERTASARQRAATSLGELGDTDSLPALVIALLGDRDANVRAACADALAKLADPDARPALRAATHDESSQVRRQASAALGHLTPQASNSSSGGTTIGQRVTVVVGRMGSKAQSGTMPDIPKRLREAVIKEMHAAPEISIIEDLQSARDTRGYSIDSSVTRMTRRTTPAGELEISCDVSMIIAVMPSRSVVGMVTGGASVIGPRGPSTRPTKTFIESLETDALDQAVHETHSSLMTFFRTQVKAQRP